MKIKFIALTLAASLFAAGSVSAAAANPNETTTYTLLNLSTWDMVFTGNKWGDESCINSGHKDTRFSDKLQFQILKNGNLCEYAGAEYRLYEDVAHTKLKGKLKVQIRHTGQNNYTFAYEFYGDKEYKSEPKPVTNLTLDPIV